MKTKTMLVKPASIRLERISWLINEKRILPIIAAIDLEMVKMKMSIPDEGEGWSVEQCDDAEIEYKRFLQLNLLHKGKSIVPTNLIDTVWHYHILDTRAYHADSEIVFGGYFHHFPYFGLRGNEDKKNLENAFEATKQLYEVAFNEPMLKSKHSSCWHDCQGRCWHACSNDDDYK